MRRSILAQQAILTALVFALAALGCSRDPQDDQDMSASNNQTDMQAQADDGGAKDMSEAPDEGQPDAGEDDQGAPADMPEDMNVVDMDGPIDPPIALADDLDYSLSVNPEQRTITIFNTADEPLLVLPVDGIQVGVVGALSDQLSYDPYGFKAEVAGGAPTLDAWLTIERIDIAASDETSATLELRFERGVRATLEVDASNPNRFRFELKPADAEGDKIAYYRVVPEVSSEEGFYGLGEYFDAVNHRGHVRAMQIEIDTSIESGYNEAHVPVPFVLGTTGWGLFVESYAPGVFDVANEVDNRVDAIFGPGKLAGEGIIFHLFAEDHPLDLTEHYYAVTGEHKLPARWTLGPLVWRDENEDEAQVLSDAETMRDLDLAVSGYWIDRPYATAVNTFDFSPDMFDDPAAMVARLHELGIRVGLWHTPYLDEDAASTLAMRTEAIDKGYYPPTTNIPLNGWGLPFDVTNPDARMWWQGMLDNYISIGIEGFKLDYGEDIIPGALKRRTVWEFDNGLDERTMHARFQIFYHSTYAEALDAPDGHFLLCRGGTWGDQVNGTIIWPGDLDANMAYHRDEVTKDNGETYTAVGGLPAALIAGSTLGPSGFPFYGSDTGGYRHSPPDKETFTRWFQHTALSPVMQIGTSTNDVAWEFNEENGFDQEMLDLYREFTRLHLRLWPYLWSYAERLKDDGRPIQRALGLAYPELGEHPNFTYMLGDWLLVAPVVDRGARTREVIFPQGQWYDWWTGEALSGGMTRTVDAPLDTLPLYLVAGGVVPMLRPTIDSLAPTTEPGRVDSYATDPGVIHYVIGGGASGGFDLFDGTSVQVTHDMGSGEHTIVTSAGAEFTSGVQLEVYGVATAPASVTEDGNLLVEAPNAMAFQNQAAGYLHDATRGVLTIKLPAQGTTVVIAP